MSFLKRSIHGERGMTFVEILIVISILAMASLAMYGALSNGIRVWNKARHVVVEEDVTIFFDKLSQDLRNAVVYAGIRYSGSMNDFSFPTIIVTRADNRSMGSEEGYVRQLGKVHYYYDPIEDAVVRQEANYSQALMETFGEKEFLARSVDRIHFQYYYLTDEGQLFSEQILDVFPSGLSVEIEFTDSLGKRVMQKFIDIPVGS